MRLLILSPISPLPIFSGGRTRLYNITRQQARRHQVTFLSFCRNEEERQGLKQLGQKLDIRVISVPFQSKKRLLRHPGRDALIAARNYALAWRRGWPADIPAWEQAAMHRALQAELTQNRYDILQVEWPYLAPYALTPNSPPTVLITHDIFSVGLARRAGVQPDGREQKRLKQQARRWQRYEAFIYLRFDLVAAMSEQDAAIIRQRAADANIIVSPNGVDTQSLTPGPLRATIRNLLFVGSPTHAPNLDAACWLLTDIWPELRRRHPTLTLTLVNLDHPRVRASADGKKGVTITGRLPDLTPIYRQADVALAPLRAASGTRLKILEAFALGVPVISTAIGYEGLAVTPGEHLLQADTPEDFIAAVDRLAQHRALRANLMQNARSLAEQRYDWTKIVDELDNAYTIVHRNRQSTPNAKRSPHTTF